MKRHQCRLLRDESEIDAIAADWDRLWHRAPIRHVFQGYAWHRAVLDAFAVAPRVVAAYDADRLVGLLPLAEASGRLAFLGAPHADYNDLLTDWPHPGEVLASMIGALRAAGLRHAVLENVREDATLRRAAAEVGGVLGRSLRWTPGATCPTLLLEGDRAAVLQALSRKKSLRRHESRLGRRGTVAFRHVGDLEEARRLLPLFFALHTARRAVAGEGLLFARPEARRLYEALLSRLGSETVRFGVLELDGTPVAFHFGFECERRFVWYKPAFDVDLWDCGPGEVLLKKLLEYAGGAGLVEFDFTRGEEAFKARFANASRRNDTLHVLPPGPAGAVAALRLAVGTRLRGRPGPRFLREALGAAARGIAAGAARRVLAQAWHRLVYQRRERLVFHRARAGSRAAPEPGFELRAAGLGDLARLAPLHPEALDARRLQVARDRLQSGDRLFLAFTRGELAHVAWVGTRSALEVPEVGPAARISLETEGALVYDCWTPPSKRGRGLFTQALRGLVAAAPVGDVWIRCDPADAAARRGIASAGFAARYRLTGTRRFGRLRVRIVPASG